MSVPPDVSDKYAVLQREEMEFEHECEVIEQQRLFLFTFTAFRAL